MHPLRQRGEGQLGCIIGLIILIAAGWFAFKMVPVKVKAADLRRTVTDSARSAGQMRDPAIRRAILDKARVLELPVTNSDIKIQRARERIRVEVNYVVPVEFPGYVYQWSFSHVAENPVF
ncbi:MAG: hypothetical protein ABR517_14165 [Thermoanaerobaculia bacterium]